MNACRRVLLNSVSQQQHGWRVLTHRPVINSSTRALLSFDTAHSNAGNNESSQRSSSNGRLTTSALVVAGLLGNLNVKTELNNFGELIFSLEN